MHGFLTSHTECGAKKGEKKKKGLPGCETWQGSVITSPTANLKASDLVMNIGSFLFTT